MDPAQELAKKMTDVLTDEELKVFLHLIDTGMLGAFEEVGLARVPEEYEVI